MKDKISRLLSFLFVKDYNCIVCGRELPAKNGYLTCTNCYQKLELIQGDRCLKCGKKLFGEGEYCLDCEEHEKSFDRAFAPVSYVGAAAALVMAFKFENKRYLASPLARYMTDCLLQEGIAPEVIVPVPLHEKREKERGYNQSELLAKEISSSLGVPLAAKATARVKETLTSSLLTGGREAREANVKGAFVVREPALVKGKCVLLVDDVLTTGATSSELAGVLRKAGASKVYVLTFATTKEKPPLQGKGFSGGA